MHSCRSNLSRRLPRSVRITSRKQTTNPNQVRTMAFFPRNFYTNTTADTSFHPLFRLLDDFDNYSRQGGRGNGGHSGRRSGIAHWQPKFDVRETGEAYELHGELPGVSKEDVHIEFSEPQTMIVRGRAERTYTAGTPPAGQIQDGGNTATITEGDDTTAAGASTPTSSHSHQATVEDEAESQAHESGFQEVVAAKKNEEGQQPKKPADKAKYWLTERSVGEFSRSFNFPSRVDQDTVTANFNNGILSVVVPKAKKRETRRIAVL